MRGRRHKNIEEDSKTLGSQIPGLSMFVIIAEIIGHRYGAGAKSDFANNWELSLARAANAAVILENAGYQQSIGISGYGSGRYHDLVAIDDETTRQDLARRVDIIIMNHSGKREKIRSLPRLP